MVVNCSSVLSQVGANVTGTKGSGSVTVLLGKFSIDTVFKNEMSPMRYNSSFQAILQDLLWKGRQCGMNVDGRAKVAKLL